VPAKRIAPLTTAPGLSCSNPPLIVVSTVVPPDETISNPPLLTVVALAAPPDRTTWESVALTTVPIATPETY